MTMLLAFAMVFTMMPLLGPQTAYADAAEANGGTVASNSEVDAKAAFGSGNVTASYERNTLTITLNSDIKLNNPVVFRLGAAGDTVRLELNGHSITAAAGSNGQDSDLAQGKDAIRIIPNEFNVEINGPGSVTAEKERAI